MRRRRAEYSIVTALIVSGAERSARALLALGQVRVAADVAALAADDEDHGVLVAEVAQPPHRRRVDPRDRRPGARARPLPSPNSSSTSPAWTK